MSDRFLPVKWGVLGAARIADAAIIPGLTNSRFCEPVAIGARDLGRARAMAEHHGIGQAYGSYEEVLADNSVEAVYIALPNHLHVEWMLKAAQAGKHVLCEKPAAMSAAELLKLKDVDPSLKISEAFMVRHQPRWIRLKELLASGTYGEVRSASAVLSFPMTNREDFRLRREFGGGAYFDLGCYATMTARYVFGAEPRQVLATMHRGGEAVDLASSVILDYGNGRIFTFVVSFAQSAAQSLQVVCEHASISVPLPYVPSADNPSAMIIDESGDLGRTNVTTLEFDAIDQYEQEVANFSRVVRGDNAPHFGLDDAASNARVADAVFTSAASRSWVAVS